MRIAIIDYVVEPTNAIGNCHRLVAKHTTDHEVTVFAAAFENPDPERIPYIQIPVIRRPLFLLFITFHIMAPIVYHLYRLRKGVQFDLVQMVESNLLFGDIAYTQFCHRAYLKKHWKETKPSGLRGFARWLDHLLHSWMEPVTFQRVKHLVVPSAGLKKELIEEYPMLTDKIKIISNPVAVERMRQPADYDRAAERAKLNLEPDDLVLVFVALGHFERKGLPILLEAMQAANNPRVKLLVVGGLPAALQTYKQRAKALGLGEQIHFVGMQKDIRPFLWAADVFAFPSSYETFSMVAYEAAAAGLPLMITHLFGVEDMLVDGENGWLLERTSKAFTEAIQEALTNPDLVQQRGEAAAKSVVNYNVEHFVERWHAFHAQLAPVMTT